MHMLRARFAGIVKKVYQHACHKVGVHAQRFASIGHIKRHAVPLGNRQQRLFHAFKQLRYRRWRNGYAAAAVQCYKLHKLLRKPLNAGTLGVYVCRRFLALLLGQACFHQRFGIAYYGRHGRFKLVRKRRKQQLTRLGNVVYFRNALFNRLRHCVKADGKRSYFILALNGDAALIIAVRNRCGAALKRFKRPEHTEHGIRKHRRRKQHQAKAYCGKLCGKACIAAVNLLYVFY